MSYFPKSDLVDLTNNQTINGVKTFTGSLIESSLSYGYKTITTTGGVTVGDNTDMLIILTGTLTHTYTLPTVTNGRNIRVINESTQSITINTTGGAYIGSGPSTSLGANHGTIEIIGYNGNWIYL